VSNSENRAPSLGTAARPFDLSDRVVVVTGASKGIGRELTILLAETGAVVVPTVRTDADAASLVAEARSRGLTVQPQRLDVRDVASINEVAAHDRIDVLVNNAGLGFARAAFDVTEADWDEMMGVNLRGAFFMSQAAARAMAESGRGGRIVNISSQGGLVGLLDAAVYCASKGGLNMMTKIVALEWAKDAIAVNAVAPTFIYTPGTAPILD
jgi:NAD(P)-dependent dehydrogenase (short-subunit alcohol dehydrogenase family)